MPWSSTTKSIMLLPIRHIVGRRNVGGHDFRGDNAFRRMEEESSLLVCCSSCRFVLACLQPVSKTTILIY